MTQNKISWIELLVTDAEGDSAGTLGDLVANAPANLDNAVLNADGSIAEWPQYFVHAEGEEPGDDTPRGDVDWSGLAEKLGR